VNGVDSTLLDVAQGSGYTPRGDYIETTSDYYSIALSDYTLNTVNYLCAVYTEVGVYNQPHETDGSTYATRYERSWRIRTYTAAEYAALSSTDDNLANDARDRMLIIALITANGASVALTSSSIQSPVDYNNILYASPSELVSITGVTVTSVSPSTGSGLGSLDYTYSVGPTYDFEWTSASGGAGTTITVTADGYWDFPDGLGEYIRCYVVVSQLPTSSAVESVNIVNLYNQDVPRLTAIDNYHRNLLGTGIVTPENPHGLSVDDIAGDSVSQLEEHLDVMHCNGIWREGPTASSMLSTSVLTTPPVADTLNIQAPSTTDLFYINGNTLNSINNTSIAFATWDPDWGMGLNIYTHLFEIYSSSSGDVKAHRKATYPLSRVLRGTWIIDASGSYPAGTYILQFNVSGSYTNIWWDGGQPVALLTADFGVAGNSRAIRLFDQAGENWIDLWVNMDDSKSASDDDKFNNGASGQDNIDILASPNWDEGMQISSVSYWYDAVTPKGKLGYAPYEVSRRVIDKRPYGTLCKSDIADSALQDLVYHQHDELHFSGVLLDRNDPGVEFRVSNIAALDITISGGNYYCRGQRLVASEDTVSLANDTTNLVWLAADGTYDSIDVTAAYSGDLQAAMKYVLGGPSYIPNADDDTHNTDDYDSPERGVLLYLVVTAGGAVSYYDDMLRNVNGPVDPWSVGARYADSNDGRMAAFDSLGAAFDYAALFNRSNGVTISIVGSSKIENRVIVQPEGVVVNGTLSDSYGKVSISYADLDGAWILSEGCKVSHVLLESAANNVAVFGIGHSLTSSGSNITIEDCVYDCLSYTTFNYFIKLYGTGYTGSDITGLTVRNNKVRVGLNFITYSTIAKNYSDFSVCNNTVECVLEASYAIAIVAISGSGRVNVYDNRFTNSNGIIMQNMEDCSIHNNTFLVGNTAAAASQGIYLRTVERFVVLDNIINPISGNTSTNIIGIYIWDLTDCTIKGNIIKGVHYGINDTASSASDGLVVSDNIIEAIDNGSSAGGIGIFTFSDNAVISGNNVYAESYGIACGPDTGCTNVKVENNLVRLTTVNGGSLSSDNIGLAGGSYCIAFAESSERISINNNTTEMSGSSGVLLDRSACICFQLCTDFVVKGNATRADYTSVSGALGAWQIFVSSTGDSSFLVSDNKVDNRTGTPDPSLIHGLRVIATGVTNVIGKVSGNVIDGSNRSVVDPNDELYVNDSTAATITLFVSDNAVADLTSGVNPRVGGTFNTSGDNIYTNNTGTVTPF
jgi:hypothetical protein